MPTKQQYKTANELLSTNPSMIWDGVFGLYSNGDVVMTIWWNFDGTKEKFKLTINPDVSGMQYMKIRMYPYHEYLCHPFETGCMVWLQE